MSNQIIKQVCTKRDMDLISCLPDNLIETILVKLPFREATRTCILARSWRYSWVRVPNLTLDDVFWQQSLGIDSQCSAAEFANILSRILLLHQGPLTSIHLHIPQLESTPEIDASINFIVRNGVNQLVLDTGNRYKLPSSLFNYERCINLTNVMLYDVTISAQAVESLVSSCRSLQRLRLCVGIDISCLKINAPKLESLLYICYPNSFQSSLDVNYGQQQGSLVKLARGFPDLQALCFCANSVKSLSAGGIPRKLPAGIFDCLRTIFLLQVCFEDADQFSFVLCVIKSCPNLQLFHIDMDVDTRFVVEDNNLENLAEEQDYSDLTLNHLVEVFLSPIVGNRSELKLIKILLAESPSLRKMKIGLATSEIVDKGLEMIKEMFMFRRASRNVDVLIEDCTDF